MLGTLSFLLSEMEPQENSEQGRDESDSGVHRHLLHVGAGGSREHRKKEAAMVQVSANEGGQDQGRALGQGRSGLLLDLFVRKLTGFAGGVGCRATLRMHGAAGKDFFVESLSIEMI